MPEVETPPVQTPAQQQAPVQQPPVQQENKMSSVIDALSGLKGTEAAIKDLSGPETTPAPVVAPVETPPVVVPPVEAPPAGTETVPAETPATTETPVVDAGIEIDSPLFGGKKKVGAKEKKKDEVVFENFEQVATVLKKDFGQDVKEIKDLGKFLTSAEGWRKDASKFKDTEKKVAQFENIFTEMPEPLLDAIKTHFNGGNWEEPIKNRPKFDYSVDVKKQDTKALVNHYFPGKFTDEDFTAESKSPALEIAEQASIDKFSTEKIGYESKRTADVAKGKQKLELRRASVAGSVSALKESFPDLPDSDIKEISSVMESGDINSLFFNTDGSFKKEAAEMLALARHGRSVISQFMDVAAKRGANEAAEDLVTRGADKPNPVKTTGGEKPSEKVLKEVENLIGGVVKKPTY